MTITTKQISKFCLTYLLKKIFTREQLEFNLYTESSVRGERDTADFYLWGERYIHKHFVFEERDTQRTSTSRSYIQITVATIAIMVTVTNHSTSDHWQYYKLFDLVFYNNISKYNKFSTNRNRIWILWYIVRFEYFMHCKYLRYWNRTKSFG